MMKRQNDDLDTARGCLNGVIGGLAIWALIAVLILATGCATVPVEERGEQEPVPWGWITAIGVGVAAALVLANDGDDEPEAERNCFVRVGPNGSDTICR